jgi:hypothetical protein
MPKATHCERCGAVTGGGRFCPDCLVAGVSDEPAGPRSLFCFELSYDFDGARSTMELYCYRSLELIRSCIQQQLLPAEAESIRHVLSMFALGPDGGSGAARVWRVEQGEAARFVDLHLHLRLYNGGTHGESTRVESVPPLEPGAYLSIDWAAAFKDVDGELSGPPLAPGEQCTMRISEPLLEASGTRLLEENNVRYGFEDQEYDDQPAQLPFIDPDPETPRGS